VILINEVLRLLLGALLPIRLDGLQLEGRCYTHLYSSLLLLFFAFCGSKLIGLPVYRRIRTAGIGQVAVPSSFRRNH
jgi:hypothetical protein